MCPCRRGIRSLPNPETQMAADRHGLRLTWPARATGRVSPLCRVIKQRYLVAPLFQEGCIAAANTRIALLPPGANKLGECLFALAIQPRLLPDTKPASEMQKLVSAPGLPSMLLYNPQGRLRIITRRSPPTKFVIFNFADGACTMSKPSVLTEDEATILRDAVGGDKVSVSGPLSLPSC